MRGMQEQSPVAGPAGWGVGGGASRGQPPDLAGPLPPDWVGPGRLVWAGWLIWPGGSRSSPVSAGLRGTSAFLAAQPPLPHGCECGDGASNHRPRGQPTAPRPCRVSPPPHLCQLPQRCCPLGEGIAMKQRTWCGPSLSVFPFLLPSFYFRGKGGTERWCYFLKLTQRGSEGSRSKA